VLQSGTAMLKITNTYFTRQYIVYSVVWIT